MEGVAVYILRVVVYIACFTVSLYALTALRFEDSIKQGKVRQAQVLFILMAMALGYLSAQFLMGFIYRSVNIIAWLQQIV
ncbi:MAG: DUF1146 domain-containing protein [Erysipelotrichaceae bacterium]|nr:DUF1146 domain-containing protein [Erysipelotrichaceae bacterium]